MDNKTNKPTYEGLTMNQLAERNAEHVTTIARLESQVKQLAAENAALKAVVHENWNLRDVLRQLIAGRPGGCYFIKWEPMLFKALNETPATDAYLSQLRNEARAEGAEYCVQALVTSGNDDFTDAPNICAEVARQLREGKAGEVQS